MTSEMEPISDAIVERRKVDATLARFSAVHDEMAREERERRNRWHKLMPWRETDDPLDDALSAATPHMGAEPPEQTSDTAEKPVKKKIIRRPLTRLQRKRAKQREQSAMAGRIAACVAALVVLALCGIGWTTRLHIDKNMQQVLALDEGAAGIQNAQGQTNDDNFLLIGTSARPGGSAAATGAETIMLAHVPANRARIQILSFPADLQVTRPICAGWNNQSGQYTGTQMPATDSVRLDDIYKQGGPRCLTDTLQDITGIAINHFVGIDFGGFQQMTNALQGVSVCVSTSLSDSQLGTIASSSGNVTLNGEEGLNFVRADHITGDTSGEQGRIRRQQLFMAAALQKLISNDVISDPSKLNDFLSSFAKATFSESAGVNQLLSFAQSVQSVGLGQITFITVPATSVTNSGGSSGEAMSTALANQLFTAVRNGGALPTSAAPATGSAATQANNVSLVAPSSVKVQVLNGTTIQGLGADTKSKLVSQGFDVINDGTNNTTVPQTVIKYSANQAAAAATLASSVPSAQLQEDPSMVSAIELILGANFDKQVNAAKSGTATLPGATSGTPATGASQPVTLTTLNAGASLTCG
ncbi:MAG TPA: LCP family protein [Pseudonocardiaceae bacterium]